MPHQAQSDSRYGSDSFDLILAPTYTEARNYNRALALSRSGGAFFGVAESVEAWVEKLWEMEGDGRPFASSLQKTFAAAYVTKNHAYRSLTATPGLARALVNCANKGNGVAAFDAAVSQAWLEWQSGNALSAGAHLTSQEREFLVCVAEYNKMLEERGLVDRGIALKELINCDLLKRPMRIGLLQAESFTQQQTEFLSNLPSAQFEQVSSEFCDFEMDASIDISMAFPSGGYAQAQLLLDVIADYMQEGLAQTFIVASAHPQALFGAVAQTLAQSGTSCAVSYSTTLGQTALGKAFLQAQSLDSDEKFWNKDALADILTGAFSGLSKKHAWNVDAQIRGDRLLSLDEALRFTQDGEDDAPYIATLMNMPLSNETSDLITDRLNALRAAGVSPAFVLEQRRALETILSAMQIADSFELDLENIKESLAAVRFSVSCAVYPEGEQEQAGVVPAVRIMDRYRASGLGVGSADCAVLCDLTSELYPLNDSQSAADQMLLSLGALSSETALERARKEFSALLALPTQALVLEFCLNNANADPNYPCSMLQEFAALYEEGSEAERGTGLFGFPAALTKKSYQKGEDDYEVDLQPSFSCGDRRHVSKQSAAFQVHDPLYRSYAGSCVPDIAPHSADQLHPELPRLSPSQIESYMDCPYKWFVMNRIGVDGLDETMGPRESGTFLHELFYEFYKRFNQRITVDNLSDARFVMFGDTNTSGVWDEIVEAQYKYDKNGRPKSTRFVPVFGTSETMELDLLRQRVDRWLLSQVRFLPGFTPVAFECSIQGVEYGGAEIRGVIDRIDVDEKGRAVVIDYKGALSSAYRPCANGEYNETGKVQALMYARILEQAGAIGFASESVEPSSALDAESLSCVSDAANEEVSFVLAGAFSDASCNRILKIDRVVGALYMSYNAGNAIVGAFDGSILGPESLPSLVWGSDCRLSTEGVIKFADLLDLTEARVATVSQALLEGSILPDPSTKYACSYCPVLDCPRRQQ